MKNLKQNLVKAILCVGVVSVSLVACESDQAEDTNVITLDQLDDVINDLDSTMSDSNVVENDTAMIEPTNGGIPMEDDVEKNEE